MRNLQKMQRPNDGSRSLFESVMAPEVIQALRAWIASNSPGVLIGGLAISFYIKPRMTQDIDILLMSDSDIPMKITGFKKTRDHAFEHLKTGVEIELVTPTHVSENPAVFQQVIATSKIIDGIRVASPSGLVALKLGRFNFYDRGDIAELLKTGEVDVSGFGLSQPLLDRYVRATADQADE